MLSELRTCGAIADSIAQLLAPHAEVVIHDLALGSIAAIYNNFSGRELGDPSDLGEELDLTNLPDVFEPYRTVSDDGRLIKSTTAVIRDEQGSAVGLMCINLDVTLMDQAQRALATFLVEGSAQQLPGQLFADESKEKIALYVRTYCTDRGLTQNVLNRAQKQDLVADLHRQGAFQAKSCADHVAQVLGISRATVYKYLALCRNT